MENYLIVNEEEIKKELFKKYIFNYLYDFLYKNNKDKIKNIKDYSLIKNESNIIIDKLIIYLSTMKASSAHKLNKKEKIQDKISSKKVIKKYEYLIYILDLEINTFFYAFINKNISTEEYAFVNMIATRNLINLLYQDEKRNKEAYENIIKLYDEIFNVLFYNRLKFDFVNKYEIFDKYLNIIDENYEDLILECFKELMSNSLKLESSE